MKWPQLSLTHSFALSFSFVYAFLATFSAFLIYFAKYETAQHFANILHTHTHTHTWVITLCLQFNEWYTNIIRNEENHRQIYCNGTQHSARSPHKVNDPSRKPSKKETEREREVERDKECASHKAGIVVVMVVVAVVIRHCALIPLAWKIDYLKRTRVPRRGEAPKQSHMSSGVIRVR